VSIITNLKEKKRKTIFKTKRKRKRKEILNNDLAILPSHDNKQIIPWISAPEILMLLC